MQSILDQVYTWCQSNRLIAPESKTEALIISSQNFIGPLQRLTYGNSTIEYKQSSKCLGLTIDNKLSWQEHIKNVCKSFSNKVAVLKRIKFLPKPVLETIILLQNNHSQCPIWYCSLGILFFSLVRRYRPNSLESNKNY